MKSGKLRLTRRMALRRTSRLRLGAPPGSRLALRARGLGLFWKNIGPRRAGAHHIPPAAERRIRQYVVRNAARFKVQAFI